MNTFTKRLSKQNSRAVSFISSLKDDREIAEEIVKINLAHMICLIDSKSINYEIAKKCIKFLLNIRLNQEHDKVAEDFHQLLELYAIDKIGIDAAGYLNLGKSRNDQVACAIRMKLRARLIEIMRGLLSLQSVILDLASDNKHIIMPGYTHLQHAQPITISHHFLAYFDSFQRSFERIQEVYRRVNLSPMGAAALAGTTIPIDRRAIAELLGFDGVVENSIDAVSSRDFAIESLACVCLIMLDLSRLAEEMILWSSKEFRFIEISDEFSASSSIMPQKKNPVICEIIRAKAASSFGRLLTCLTIMKALPHAYNLDLQEMTPMLWESLKDSIESINIMGMVLRSLTVNSDAINESMNEDFSTATNLADYLVINYKIPFRVAHMIVGELVRRAYTAREPFVKIVLRDLPSVSSKLARKEIVEDEEKVRSVLDPERAISSIVTYGGSNPNFLDQFINERRRLLTKGALLVSKLDGKLNRANTKLIQRATSIGMCKGIN